jgi:hypothetical protein
MPFRVVDPIATGDSVAMASAGRYAALVTDWRAFRK